MSIKHLIAAFGLVAAVAAPAAHAASVLYSQDFEQPNGYVNDGGDVNIVRSVGQLYGTPTVQIDQAYSVETLRITGSDAFGHGYSDPSGKGGNYAVSMLSSNQEDHLYFALNTGGYRYLNVSMDVSSIDVSVFGGPVGSTGQVPALGLTVWDNPTGQIISAYGNGIWLDYVEASGVASTAPDVFEWTRLNFTLDLSKNGGSVNNTVLLDMDLIAGGYAALDNLRFVASDRAGDMAVPEPGSLALVGVGAVGLGLRRRQRPARAAA